MDAFHRLQLLPQLKERATDTNEAAKVFIEFVSGFTVCRFLCLNIYDLTDLQFHEFAASYWATGLN